MSVSQSRVELSWHDGSNGCKNIVCVLDYERISNVVFKSTLNVQRTYNSNSNCSIHLSLIAVVIFIFIRSLFFHWFVLCSLAQTENKKKSKQLGENLSCYELENCDGKSMGNYMLCRRHRGVQRLRGLN